MNREKKPVILVCARGFWNERELAKRKIFHDRFELLPLDDSSLPNGVSERVVGLVLGDKPFSEDLMAAFPDLKTIARNGAGYDNVDLVAAKRRGIIVTRIASINTKSVSEFAIGLILALSRNIVSMHRNLSNGIWKKERGRALSEMTIGIVGVGAIGRLLAKNLHSLGAGRIIGWNRSRRPEVLELVSQCSLELVELPVLMSESDAVVVSVMLVQETANLINKRLLSLMKPDAFLVNTSRGAVIDEEALAELVIAGKIGGAALDVFSIEPPIDQPFMRKLVEYVRNGGNVILSPHSASLTKSSEQESVLLAARNIVNVLDGNLEGVEIV